jgi:hypothetical protein
VCGGGGRDQESADGRVPGTEAPEHEAGIDSTVGATVVVMGPRHVQEQRGGPLGERVDLGGEGGPPALERGGRIREEVVEDDLGKIIKYKAIKNESRGGKGVGRGLG